MDGLTLLSRDASTQAMFNAVWGDRASLRWATEHNHEMHEKMMGGMPMGGQPAAAPAPEATSPQVKIVEPAFQPTQAWTYEPNTISTRVGQAVTWTNGGAVAHTVTADDGRSFDSGTMAPGATFTFTPSTAGAFGYHCTFHPWMKGTLTVSA